MTKTTLFGVLMIALSPGILAHNTEQFISDTIALEEIEILNSPKNNTTTDKQTGTHYSIGIRDLESRGVGSMQEVSMFVPNFYIPDYGSKATSSIVIRGIGSRMNEPAIGLYVDNIPYLDKSAYDFSFFDLNKLTILQGPQGALFGRNAIGGTMMIETLSPLYYQGTRLFVSYGTKNESWLRLSHYNKPSPHFGISVATYYNHNDGYFTNTFTTKSDVSNAVGGRIKLEWLISDAWSVRLSTNLDFSNQLGYPYARLDSTNKPLAINYNEQGSYQRGMIANGLQIQRKGNGLLFTSSTSYQHLQDKMVLDQDFTSDSIMELNQHQRINILTQEFIIRSNTCTPWQWISGLFAFGNSNHINAPMKFNSGGISMLQGFLDAASANNPNMPKLTITNREMPISGSFNKMNWGIAFYHQSSYKFDNGIGITAGIRADYEQASIDYLSEATLHTLMQLPIPGIPAIPVDSTYKFTGNDIRHFFEISPRLSLNYKANQHFNSYITLSRGYKAGGYNYSMISDIIQSAMQNKPTTDVGETIYYLPEESWNSEIGLQFAHENMKMQGQLTLFYQYLTNQQMVTSASNGSRMITNAKHGRSVGLELFGTLQPIAGLTLQASYGYTNARFTEYSIGDNHYAGNYVPYVPQNTIAINLHYEYNIHKSWLKQLVFDIGYQGLGNQYWTVDNRIKEPFYSLLNTEVGFVWPWLRASFWVKNATNTTYNTFHFESFGNRFVQQGKPIRLGLTLKSAF